MRDLKIPGDILKSTLLIIAGALGFWLVTELKSYPERPLPILDPEDTSGSAEDNAVALLLGRVRKDGRTFGSFVFARVHRECPDLSPGTLGFSGTSEIGERGPLRPWKWVVRAEFDDRDRERVTLCEESIRDANPLGALWADTAEVIIKEEGDDGGGPWYAWLREFSTGKSP